MALARQIAMKRHLAHDVVDDAYNRQAFEDRGNLPAWFLEDERQHSRVVRPVDTETARTIKNKLRALNSRPIKRVREAKQRKKQRAARKAQKIRRKLAS